MPAPALLDYMTSVPAANTIQAKSGAPAISWCISLLVLDLASPPVPLSQDGRGGILLVPLSHFGARGEGAARAVTRAAT